MKTHPRALTAGYVFCVHTAQVLTVISSAQLHAASGPHRALEYGGSRHSPSTVPSFIVVLSVLFWGCRTGVFGDLCDAFQPTRGKLGLINAGHLIPQSAFYLFLKHRAAQTEIVVFVLENLMLKGHVAGEKMPTETSLSASLPGGPWVSLKCLVPKTWDVVSPEGTCTPHWKHHLQKDWQLGQWHLKSSICIKLVWAGAAGWSEALPSIGKVLGRPKSSLGFSIQWYGQSWNDLFGQPSISTNPHCWPKKSMASLLCSLFWKAKETS